MKTTSLALLLPLSSLAVPVPGGHDLSASCILAVSNGEVVTSSHLSSLSDCKAASSLRKEQIYAQDVHLENPDLWQNFTASWTVPPLPSNHAGQVDYHWSGFKSGEPEMGYPVLQPVLQYGQTGRAKWQVQSWYVWGDGGKAVTGPAVAAEEGDAVDTYMTLSDDGVWTVYARNGRTGEESVLTIERDALGCDCDFEWAMLVHETIMDAKGYCDEYPAGSSGIEYTNVYLDGATVAWEERVQKTDCEQAVNVDGEKVAFTWKN
mmetsp:Transcript_27589/g.55158  ORF Transcript_27589/g.55158 Transcript_27589/m.55158 type:complete len:263 (-) Transcript_27589:44-832(-)